MPVTKSDFLQYLSDTATRETTRQNNKETSVWAAIVLYFLLILEVVKRLLSWPYVATLLDLGAFAVVVYILRHQYRGRKEAANLVGACYRLMVEYLPKDEEYLQNVDFTVAPLQEGGKKSLRYDDGTPGPYPYILPNVLLDMMKKMNQVGHRPRIGLESGSYLVAIFGLAMTLGIIWSAILEVVWSEILERLVSYLF